MRAGYGSRGVIYTLIGGLAILAAVKSTQASGTKDALAALRDEPYGVPALFAIGIGLLAYLVWRVTAGVKDVEDEGTDPKGLIARLGQITTGLIHGGIGVSVLALAMSGKNSGGDSAKDWTQKLMSMPMGRYIVAAIALILLGAGIYYAYKGWSGKYKGHLARTQFTESIDPVLTIGLVVYGMMMALVAGSLGYAALTSNPEQAGGLGEALQSLRSVAYGRFLLGGAGLGLIGFAIYNFVEAGYRVVPKFSDPDIRTLLD
ncbi:DUF1206 domain-containing protein [Sulfitobacter sp. S0837]|nr:DUF1206 domain-containing protein [Sulfitobacter maritimus]